MSGTLTIDIGGEGDLRRRLEERLSEMRADPAVIRFGITLTLESVARAVLVAGLDALESGVVPSARGQSEKRPRPAAQRKSDVAKTEPLDDSADDELDNLFAEIDSATDPHGLVEMYDHPAEGVLLAEKKQKPVREGDAVAMTGDRIEVRATTRFGKYPERALDLARLYLEAGWRKVRISVNGAQEFNGYASKAEGAEEVPPFAGLWDTGVKVVGTKIGAYTVHIYHPDNC